jgi:hypothetical protein
MQKLDRLGWAAGIAFSAYGLRIGIRVNQERFPEELIERLPFGSKILDFNKGYVEQIYSISIANSESNARVRRFHLVFSDALRIARTLDFNEAAQALESDLQRFVAEFSRHEVFIHAGVVAWKNRAILVPGKTFSGKSTLVMALIQAGATYYSDEYAVVDSAGRVRPYRGALSLRQGGHQSPIRLKPTELHATSKITPLKVGAVISTRFKPDAKWKPRELSPAQGLLKLISHTVQARSRSAVAFSRLQKLSSGTLFLQGIRGEAREIASHLLSKEFQSW